MDYRRLQLHDIPQVLALQERNLFANLNMEECSDGFLLRAFSEADFLKMDQELCVIVAVTEETIVGYLCASVLSIHSSLPSIVSLYTACQSLTYKEKPLTEYRAFVPSPLCIERDYRGKNIFASLCNAVLASLPSDYELAITFISIDNTKSLLAARAVGFQTIGQFLLDERLFWILVYEVDLRHQRQIKTCRKQAYL